MAWFNKGKLLEDAFVQRNYQEWLANVRRGGANVKEWPLDRFARMRGWTQDGGGAPKPTAGGPTAPTVPLPTSGGGGGSVATPTTEPSMVGLRTAAGVGSGELSDVAGIENLGGPSRFRQGIGTRIPPQYSQALAALMKVY